MTNELNILKHIGREGFLVPSVQTTSFNTNIYIANFLTGVSYFDKLKLRKWN